MTQLSLFRKAGAGAWCEPFAGSAAVALYLFGVMAPVGYAGNKRRVAPRLTAHFWPRLDTPSRVSLADIGPWGTVWRACAGGHLQRIIEVIRDWPDCSDFELWHQFARQPVPSDPIERAASFLFLQARQAHHAPIWICQADGGARWVRNGGGAPHHRAIFRGDGGRWGEALSRRSLLLRLNELLTVPWQRFEVYADAHEAVRAVKPGDVVYMDPPYQGALVRYAGGPPALLAQMALEAMERGGRVVVSDSRPLDLPGWIHRDITDWFGRGCRQSREIVSYQSS